jgi:hypothetical protein
MANGGVRRGRGEGEVRIWMRGGGEGSVWSFIEREGAGEKGRPTDIKAIDGGFINGSENGGRGRGRDSAVSGSEEMRGHGPGSGAWPESARSSWGRAWRRRESRAGTTRGGRRVGVGPACK